MFSGKATEISCKNRNNKGGVTKVEKLREHLYFTNFYINLKFSVKK